MIILNKDNVSVLHDILYDYPAKLGISYKNFRLLLEAYRRKHILDAGDKFLGLDYPSVYKKCLLFEPSFGLTPKAVNWFRLTKLGEKKLEELEAILSIEKGSESVINNEFFKL